MLSSLKKNIILPMKWLMISLLISQMPENSAFYKQKQNSSIC